MLEAYEVLIFVQSLISIERKLFRLSCPLAYLLVRQLLLLLQLLLYYYYHYYYYWGHAVAQLVEALRYKPEGRGFDSRWCH